MTEKTAVTLVLIVEDNPIDVRLLKYALTVEKDWPTEVVVAADGEKAFEYIDACARGEAKRPDLMTLDLNLPRRLGSEVLQKLRETVGVADLPVAVVSSAPLEVIRRTLADAGVQADACFEKPLGLDEFAALGKKLRACLARSKGSGA